MRLEYKNKFSDILLFNAVHQFLSLSVQSVCLILMAFIFWSESFDSSLPSAALTAFYWYLGMWIFQFSFNAIYLFSRKNHSILAMHTVEVLDDSFLEQTQFNKTYSYWHGIVKAVSRPGFIAVYLTPHLAHVIPNRTFTSSEHREKFLALVKEKIRTARP